MTPALWATVRGGGAPGVRDVVDRAFERTPTPAPYDILNIADEQSWERPEWPMAVFGLLPIADPPVGHFLWATVSKPGQLLIHTRAHERHFALFLETRPAGWAPRANIVRTYAPFLTVVP